MTPRTVKLFVIPELLSAHHRGEVSLVIRALKGVIDPSKQHSKIGFRGDKWVVVEKGVMHGKNIFQRADDNSSVYRSRTGRSEDGIIHDKNYRDGEIIKAIDMPKWAGRLNYEIKDVSYPVLASSLDEVDILQMGVREINNNGVKIFRWGDIEVVDKDPIQAFNQLWRLTENKNGDQDINKTWVTKYFVVKT